MTDAATGTDAGQQQQTTQTQAPQSSMMMGGGEQHEQQTQTNGAEQGRTDGQGHNSGGHFDQNGDWRAGFAEGLDDETKESWGKLSSRYTSPSEMAKAHVNLVKTMDKRIPIPDENAKPEEMDAVFMKLGMPETADKYEFKFPQDAPWDDEHKETLKGLAPHFRKARATQEQVNMFLQEQAQLDKVAIDAARARANTLAQQRMGQLKTEWRGEDFERNRQFVGTTVRHYAGADTEEIAGMTLSDGTFVVDHPAFARMFARIGAERSEDDRDPTAFNTGMRQNAQAEIDRLEQEAIEKGLSPSDPKWPHAKLEPLYKKLNGARNAWSPNATGMRG